MAELATLARPYAKAVFELAKGDQALDRLVAYAGVSGCGCRRCPECARCWIRPDLTDEVKAERLMDLCGEELNDRARALVRILARNKRLEALPEIRDQFEVRKAEEERMLDVEVVTAHPLSGEQSDKLRDALQRRFQREVNLTSRVDQRCSVAR